MGQNIFAPLGVLPGPHQRGWPQHQLVRNAEYQAPPAPAFATRAPIGPHVRSERCFCFTNVAENFGTACGVLRNTGAWVFLSATLISLVW